MVTSPISSTIPAMYRPLRFARLSGELNTLVGQNLY